MPADNPSDKRAVLQRHPLFGHLEDDERVRLAAYMRRVRYPDSTVLFRKGDPGTNMMVVVQGRVKACTHSEDGKELVLRIINPGEVIGEIALIDGAERTADGVTMGASELLVLERRDFVPFLGRHPEACMRLLSLLCQRLRLTSQQLEDATFLEGSKRVARRLIELAENMGQATSGGVRIVERLSQQQLGNLAGMSRESINKQLKRWNQEGIITAEKGFMVITDLEKLRFIAYTTPPEVSTNGRVGLGDGEPPHSNPTS